MSMSYPLSFLRTLRGSLLASTLVALAMVASSCESTTSSNPQPVQGSTSGDRAVFILNEGQFGLSNSSLDVQLVHRTLTIHDSANKIDTITRFDTVIRKNVLSG